jgi:molybdopterin/thiamine biosynthesis adenylyltransferase
MSDDELSFQAEILRDDDPGEHRRLEELRADSRIQVLDHRAELLDSIQELRPAPTSDVTDEPTRWAYYPWRRALVGILGPVGYRALRLDRNRNLITTEEQGHLGAQQIGVAGLSVGHVIAYTLAQQGLCGMIRLADFDHLELSNLNRVPASILDVGVNKAVVTARRIAELDPYLRVEVMTDGVTPELVDDFLAGLDLVVEECDSLAMKVMLRESARTLRLPVVMATSDRGLVDVERFDAESDRPILHGLLGNVSSAELAGLSRHDRIPYMLRHLDASRSSQRLTASLVELDNTLSTWPQLAGDVIMGAAAIAEAVRRIGVGESLQSGQVRIDVGAAFDELGEVPVAPAPVPSMEPRDEPMAAAPATEPLDLMARAAVRAPSGGNAQPWTVETHGQAVVVEIAPQHTSMMDVGFRGSAVAVGAAVFNARVAAAAHGVLGAVTWNTGAPSPLSATVTLGDGEDPALAALYEPMLRRETNRRLGSPQPIGDDVVAALHDAAAAEGARLSLLTDRDAIEQTATIFGAGDRIRYLTPQLHRELIGELRWPGAEFPDSGIDVRSLELDEGDLAVLEIVKRADVMTQLASWGAGEALGDDVRKRVRSSSGIAVLTVAGDELTDFARGGMAVEAVWILAQRAGLAVQPISPVFLHAVHASEVDELSPAFAADLRRLQSDFRAVAGTRSDEAQVLVMRFAHAGTPSHISRRRQSPSGPSVA